MSDAESSVNLVERILDATGWTQTRLVHELRRTARALDESEPAGLDAVTVNRWKQGRQTPGSYYRRLLRCLYATSVAAVGGHSQMTDEVDGMKRRRFLACTAALTGSGLLDLEHLADHGVGIDARRLDALEASIRDHARRWYLTRPDVLLAPVRQQLGAANELRLRERQPAVRRRLSRLTGEATALAGWLAWLSGNYDAAHAYYTFSSSLATEERDDDARAFVLVARSFLVSNLFRPDTTHSSQPLALLDQAVGLTERSSSPFTRAFALVRRAEEVSSAAGAAASADASLDLDRAETALAAARGADEGFFDYLNTDRVMGCRGTCAMLQDRPNEAISMLSSVLAATPDRLTEERSILLADLGAAYAMRDEPEQACLLLARSVSIGGDGDVNRIGRVRAVRRAHLSAWTDTPAVRDLDEKLRA